MSLKQSESCFGVELESQRSTVTLLSGPEGGRKGPSSTLGAAGESLSPSLRDPSLLRLLAPRAQGAGLNWGWVLILCSPLNTRPRPCASGASANIPAH